MHTSRNWYSIAAVGAAIQPVPVTQPEGDHSYGDEGPLLQSLKGKGAVLAGGLTEAMGGTLAAEDTPGGGLTMTITLPPTLVILKAAWPSHCSSTLPCASAGATALALSNEKVVTTVRKKRFMVNILCTDQSGLILASRTSFS